MKKYLGVKIVHGEPMTDYEFAKTIDRPYNVGPKPQEGYKVLYLDGYVSWSPKEVFKEAYRIIDGNMTFGLAIEAMRKGYKVARKGWNDRGMHLFLMHGRSIQSRITECYGNGVAEETPVVVDSICMYTAQKTVVVGWLASQTDMLADDWEIV